MRQGLGEEVLYGCLSVDAGRQCFYDEVGVILPSALMGDFVKENHFRVGECSSTFDGLITGVVDDAV